MNKIYIWARLDCGTYYEDGCLIVLAKNIRQAREIALANGVDSESMYYDEFKRQILVDAPAIFKFNNKSQAIYYNSGAD